MDPPPGPAVSRTAVLYQPKIGTTRRLAEEIRDWLGQQGIECSLGSVWEEEAVRPLIASLDLIVVVGGDGSMLRAARMAAAHGVRLLGVNMGRLGFLSEMNPANWRDRLPRVLAGDCWLEKRLMLRARSWHNGDLKGEHEALNDVVISRGGLARVIRLRTEIDGEPLTTYVADGLILSTPTGSTAYALAVGGPILPPELRNILMIPIAPHLSLGRAVVLSEGAAIRVHIGTDHQAILTVDGQFEFELADGDYIDISAGEHLCHFVRLGERSYFYNALLARLGLRQIEDTD